MYLQAISEPGHVFAFQIAIYSNAKQYKLQFSSLFKIIKTSGNQLQVPL
jgi:hypothetical protein